MLIYVIFQWTREGMATLAALNVAGKLKGYPLWSNPNNIMPFLDEHSQPPAACPSIVNSKALGLPVSDGKAESKL
jgi:hydroxypyruvate reductase 1